MEEYNLNGSGSEGAEPRYTKSWIGLQILYVFVIAGILTGVSMGITSLAGTRLNDGLLTEAHFNLVSSAANYCFALIAISLLSVTLIELTFRRSMNVVQYILIGSSLCLFFLLLLSMAEHMPFWAAYIVVSLMTMGLISWFIRAINRSGRAAYFCAGILGAEYGLLLLMVYLGEMVLLVGSLLLFALIALAMFFTLRLKMEDEEIVLK